MTQLITILIFSFLLLSTGCQQSTSNQEAKEEFKPKGDLSDLTYNPIRADGSIDSSYLPIMIVEEEVFDFGTINEGDVVEKNIAIKNIGTAPLLIINATSSCGCTVPLWPDKPIPMDSTGEITIKFDSKNKEGLQNKEVTIFANTIPNKKVITIRGMVEKSN